MGIDSQIVKQNINQLLDLANNIVESKKEQLSWVELINDSGKQILHMVEHSLDILKMEEGTYKLNPLACDVVKIFQTICEDLKKIITSKSLIIKIFINQEQIKTSNTYYISGEKIQLQNLFSNLIKNAIEASPENKIITVSIIDEKKWHRIVIHNFGNVPDDIKDRFFDRYTTSGKKGGTGLGTYSAFLITKIHKGKISFESDEIKGTQLTVLLPRKELVFKDMSNENNDYIISKKININLDVLIVDDNDINQQVAWGLLNDIGIKADIANNGKEAFDAVLKKKYNIVFMDLEMPVMNGIDTIKLIRDNELTKDINIVAMTAHSKNESIDELNEINVYDFISKPIDANDFYKLIEKFSGISSELIIQDSLKNNKENENVEKTLDDFVVSQKTNNVIDIEAALKKLFGKKLLFLDLLNRFSKEHSGIVQSIKDAFENNDIELAERLSHTLKGLAGFLAASALEDAARKIEIAFKNREISLINKLLIHLQNTFTPVLDNVKRIIDKENNHIEQKTSENSMTKLEIQEKYINLFNLIKDFDSDAIDIMNEIEEPVKNILKSQDDIDKWKEICINTNKYDFTAALNIMEQFAKDLNIKI